MSFAEVFRIRNYHVALFVILRLAISVEHLLVTDRQTPDYGIYRGSMASHGKSNVHKAAS